MDRVKNVIASTIVVLVTSTTFVGCQLETSPETESAYLAAHTTTMSVSGFANLYHDSNPETQVGSISPISVQDACITAGGEIEIQASGCTVDAGASCTGPDGYSSLFRGLRVYSLIGRWGTDPETLDANTIASPPFFIGSNATLTAPSTIGDYYLFLADNDGNFSDNGGAYEVVATWDGASTCDRCVQGENLTGTAEDEALDGGDDNDIIHGGQGSDHLHGGACHDQLYGEDGDDELDGDEGDDVMDGGAGNDELDGEEGNDTLYGGPGNDELDGDDGDDLLYGGDGDDELDGDDGDDELDGEDGNDNLDGDAGNDLVAGGAGEDWMHGADGDDHLLGGDDDDALIGDRGDDTLDGGPGNDRAYYSGPSSEYVITNHADGSITIEDTVSNRDGTDTLYSVEDIRFGSSIPWT